MSLDIASGQASTEPSSGLSKPTILLHWAVAICFLAVLFIGVYMVDLPRGPEKGEMIGLHKSLGVLVLVLASIRLAWRFKEGKIKSVAKLDAAKQKAADAVHGLLLLATVAMPLSGAIMSVAGGRSLDFFGLELIAAGDKNESLQSIAHTFHVNAPYLIYAILVLHLAAAIKHHFIDKDATLKRMLGKG